MILGAVCSSRNVTHRWVTINGWPSIIKSNLFVPGLEDLGEGPLPHDRLEDEHVRTIVQRLEVNLGDALIVVLHWLPENQCRQNISSLK